ncbi:lauroyl-Kdo(2)-lipid IV(A) myristoyltransferase [Vibrio ziniensis]|uniref:Lipid A biosynthesis acyltransferase n=1 Tax=Vibrio ziniensis TaxID=2711221 RepID=A0A6G7CLL4_9VIBR|nr:lauroyl-Kdo(2)-lipid IV(A) myristoyltransferase [Vibrio ziniensis]QIH42992.1 lauroyl-Kdo(2)-lipid IV(A) myristoyltransferase [Vibrio ziniensis]
MSSTRNDFDPSAYHPTFEWHFLAPKYWGTWFILLLLVPIALLPVRFRYWVSTKVVRKLIKQRKSTTHTAWVNLEMCFPEKSEQEREEILFQTLVTAGVFLTGFSLVTLRNKKWLEKQCDLRGVEHIHQVIEQGHNVILLAPHTWAIDIPAVLLASRNLPVAGMAKKQSNEVIDWLMHRQRVQYGGRVYERSGGIKPFIKAIRDGYLGYYLPDQDHGREQSIFVDFFAATKATLPGLGKLAKVSKAVIIPIYAMIDAKTGRYIVNIYPQLAPFPTGSEEQDARAMNAFIEEQATMYPEQYMWILKLLRTQPDGKNYYKLAKQKMSSK